MKKHIQTRVCIPDRYMRGQYSWTTNEEGIVFFSDHQTGVNTEFNFDVFAAAMNLIIQSEIITDQES